MNALQCIVFLFCFFSVPPDPVRKEAWIKAIEKYQEFDYYVSRFVVCEKHFLENEIRKVDLRKKLLPNVLPSVFPKT